MVRLLRGILSGLGVVLIGMGVGAVLAKPAVEELVRNSLEAELSAAFGVPVTASAVRVSLLRRAVRIESMVVSNPGQFRDEPAFTCDQVLVKIHPVSLLTRRPRIHRVEVRGATVNYRYKLGTGTNIAVLTDALEAYAAAHPHDRAYKVAVMEARGAKVHFSTNLVPLASVGMRVVNVREENVEGLGSASNIQLARVLLLSIIKEAVTLKGLTDPLLRELKELVG